MTGTDSQRVRHGRTAPTAQPTHRDRRMFRTMNDPVARGPVATRAQRQLAVAAHVALTAGLTAALATLVLTGGLWWTAALVAALVLWIPVTGVLNGATRGLLELRSRMLDERQLDERGTVHTLAHRVSFSTMLLAFGGLVLAHRSGVTPAELAAPIALTGLGVLVVHWLLPLWIAALRVPDEPAEDDDVALADG